MKLQLLAASTLLVVATAAYADDFSRTLSVSSQADVYVSTGSGNIRISPSSDNQVHVTGHVHAGWSAFGDVKAREQRIIDNPPIVQNGNQIRIGEISDRSLLNNLSIDYEVSVPSTSALNLHSGSGDIEVADVGRYLSAATGSGNVRAHGIHGPAELQTGSGDIELQQDGVGDVKAKTGSGNVHINEFNGSLTLRTGSGDIEAAGRLAGSSNVNTGSGSVRLHLNPDSHFNLQAATGSGDIRVKFPGAPKQDDNSRHHLTASINGGGDTLEIHTGSGDIEVAPR
ncbi:MAG TPA: DUF4097 family beta strand repeat-containing protein [Granulicella sp.]|jgi:DUF4097 and DUF4098 domain-containing protein YvlB